jgi:hypothetical protein
MAQVRIEHRLGISAPAHIIWEAISDLGQWGAWNPTYPKVSGRLSIGAPIVLEEALPGEKQARQLQGSVVDWVPDMQLLVALKPTSGIRTLWYLEIDKLSDHGCIFASGAILEGWRARFVSRHERHARRAGFEAMNEAVKARAEEMWRRARGDPIS